MFKYIHRVIAISYTISQNAVAYAIRVPNTPPPHVRSTLTTLRSTALLYAQANVYNPSNALQQTFNAHKYPETAETSIYIHPNIFLPHRHNLTTSYSSSTGARRTKYTPVRGNMVNSHCSAPFRFYCVVRLIQFERVVCCVHANSM